MSTGATPSFASTPLAVPETVVSVKSELSTPLTFFEKVVLNITVEALVSRVGVIAV